MTHKFFGNSKCFHNYCIGGNFRLFASLQPPHIEIKYLFQSPRRKFQNSLQISNIYEDSVKSIEPIRTIGDIKSYRQFNKIYNFMNLNHELKQNKMIFNKIHSFQKRMFHNSMKSNFKFNSFLYESKIQENIESINLNPSSQSNQLNHLNHLNHLNQSGQPKKFKKKNLKKNKIEINEKINEISENNSDLKAKQNRILKKRIINETNQIKESQFNNEIKTIHKKREINKKEIFLNSNEKQNQINITQNDNKSNINQIKKNFQRKKGKIENPKVNLNENQKSDQQIIKNINKKHSNIKINTLKKTNIDKSNSNPNSSNSNNTSNSINIISIEDHSNSNPKYEQATIKSNKISQKDKKLHSKNKKQDNEVKSTKKTKQSNADILNISLKSNNVNSSLDQNLESFQNTSSELNNDLIHELINESIQVVDKSQTNLDNINNNEKYKFNSLKDENQFLFPDIDPKSPPYNNFILQSFFKIMDKLYIDNNGITKIGVSLTNSYNDLALFLLLYFYCNNRRIDLWILLINSNNNLNSEEFLWIHAWLKNLKVQHSIIEVNQNFENFSRFSTRKNEERTLRHEIIISESKKRNIDVFCTSHNLTDRIEIFLQRWASDSHLKGLVSSWEISSGKEPMFLKPLLEFKDSDLKNFLEYEFQWDKKYLTKESDSMSMSIRDQWNKKIIEKNNSRKINLSEDSFIPLLNVLKITNDAIEEHVQSFLSKLDINWIMRFIKIRKSDWSSFLKLEPYIQMRVFVSIISFVSGQKFQFQEMKLKNLIESMQSGHARTLGNVQFTNQFDGWIITKEVRGTKDVLLDFNNMCTRNIEGDIISEITFDPEKKELISSWDNRFNIHMKINEEYFSVPEDYSHITLFIRPWEVIHEDVQVKNLIDSKRVPNGYYANRIYLGSLPCITNDHLTCLYIPHISLTLGHIFSNVEVHPIYRKNLSEFDTESNI